MKENEQNKANTTVVNRHIVFLKDDAGWYADMEGTRAQNAIVSGADTMIEAHIEDILATAKLKEVRTYPKNEIMYVRVEVRFLTETAEWSRPYQMLAAWDCFNILKGYVFPVGKGTRTRLPIELENPENAAQRTKRMQLAAVRAAAMKGKE